MPRYLCEYVYRASLMQAAKRGKDFSKRVLFMHVPPKEQPYNVETGIEVVKKLAEGMVRDGEGFKGHEETRNL